MLTLNEVYGKDSQQLVESWKSKIDAVARVKSSYSDDEKVKLAVLLENTARAVDRAERSRTSAGALNETTSTNDIALFKKYAFDLVTAVYSSLVAEEIVSVQPLQSKVGMIYFMKYVYGTTKGNIPAGTTVFDARSTGSGKINYSNELVEEEFVASSVAAGVAVDGNVAYIPMRPSTVLFKGTKADGSEMVVTDDGNGHLIGDVDAAGSNTVNYSTGHYNFTFVSASSSNVVVTYETNFEANPQNAPMLDVKIEEAIIQARSRRLRALYSFDAAYDLKMMHGVDLDQSLLVSGASEIKHEIDTEILNDLLKQAGGGQVQWNSTPSQYVAKIDHKDTFVDTLVTASNIIFTNTRRAVGNYIIVGRKGSDVVESLGSRFKPSGVTNVAGPYIAGVLDGRWKVIKNPYYGEGDFVVGYKGDIFLDAGYVYAPYLPVFTTSVIMMDDFVGRRGFATYYGKKMLNPKLFVQGNII